MKIPKYTDKEEILTVLRQQFSDRKYLSVKSTSENTIYEGLLVLSISISEKSINISFANADHKTRTVKTFPLSDIEYIEVYY